MLQPDGFSPLNRSEAFLLTEHAASRHRPRVATRGVLRERTRWRAQQESQRRDPDVPDKAEQVSDDRGCAAGLLLDRQCRCHRPRDRPHAWTFRSLQPVHRLTVRPSERQVRPVPALPTGDRATPAERVGRSRSWSGRARNDSECCSHPRARCSRRRSKPEKRPAKSRRPDQDSNLGPTP